MATANNPENPNPKDGATDLGQISTEHANPAPDELACTACGKSHTTGYSNEAEIDRVLGNKQFVCMDCYNGWTAAEKDAFWRGDQAQPEPHNPNPWVVVEFPGTDREQIVIDFPTAREAFRYVERNYTEDECDVDVMRRRDDGVLTTEF